ncbi:hypothetical protein ACHAXA_010971 [Cyclostephanos tholiformis]|uniref:dAMP1 SANT/Myb-like domain-containing protein n=1 Tax=Cyclostephanos tholiformis TaxID=382380 RepID=A0ABD3RZZ7_9STRA
MTGSAMSDTKILESLPPIVPSFGFPRIKRSGNPIDDATTMTTNESSLGIGATAVAPSAPIASVAPIPPMNVPDVVRVGNRMILTSRPTRSWAWRSFASTARRDGAEFHHWVRANVEYADYPYARFDVCLDPLDYTDEEYARFLETSNAVELTMGGGGGGWDLVTGERGGGMGGGDGKGVTAGTRTKHATGDPIIVVEDNDASKNSTNGKPSSSSSTTTTTTTLQRLLSAHNKVLPWTKSETDALLELARSCDLRWSVIIDRWRVKFANSPTSRLRMVEDLQHRYYEVGDVLIRRRAEAIVAGEAARRQSSGGEGGTAPPPVAADLAVVVGEGPRGGDGGASATVASDGVGSAKTASAAAVAVPVPSNAIEPPELPAESASATKQQQQSESDAVISPAEVFALQQQISLDPSLVPSLSLPGSGTAHHRGGRVFNLAAERARRAQLDRLWHRTKDEEREEEELRAELRMVEAQLRKLKRAGKHVAPAGSALAAPAGVDVVAAGASTNQTSSSAALLPSHRPMPPPSLPPRPPLDVYLQTHQSVSASFVETAPVPTPGTPYLQSGRLFPPAVEGHSGLNNNTLKQMNAILQELNVPKEPIPTKRNCDLYDGVRKDALTLLVLQKILLRKEVELNSKRDIMLEIQRAAAVAAAEKEEAETKKKCAAKEEAETKKMSDKKKAEETNDGNSDKIVSKAKTKRQRADSAASNQDNTAAAGVRGAGEGKKGNDGPKTKYRKKSKAEPNLAGTAAIAVATSLPTAATSETSSSSDTGQPPANQAATNLVVSPMFNPAKQPALARPSSPIDTRPQPLLENIAVTDANNTSAPVNNPAKVPGKRGRKPKKKDP